MSVAENSSPKSKEQNPVCRNSKGLLGSRAQGKKMEITRPHVREIKNLRYDFKRKNRSSTAGVPMPQKVSFLVFSHRKSLFFHSKEA